MLRLMVICALLAMVTTTQAATIRTLVPTDFANNTAVQSTWSPVVGAPATVAPERTPDGKPAVAFHSHMTSDIERTYWDTKVNLDLSRHGKVAFWVKAVGDAGAISSCMLYFNAGSGWYDGSFGIEQGSWQRVTLNKHEFITEGSPQGWDTIRTVRLAFWKGQTKDVTVYLGPIEAPSSGVVVVAATREGKEAQGYVEHMISALNSAGIDAEVLHDTEVENGALTGKRVCIYPNNNPTPKEAEALRRFTQAGGRVLACYALNSDMADILGITNAGYLRSAYDGQFACMRAVTAAGAVPGMPAQVHQNSWNINIARATGHNARAIAQWYDSKGKDTGHPAIMLSDTGAYVTHIILDDTPTERDGLLRAVLGALDPAIWSDIANASQLNAGRIVNRWATFEETAKGIEAEAKRLKVASALAQLTIAQKARALANKQINAKQWPDALATIEQQRNALNRAYALAQPCRPKEFRATWCHSAYGVAGVNWDQAIKRLKECGFTAVIPNMLWGGLADYQSEVLPVNDRVRTEGDQIAKCLAACRKYGLQIHVWKVDWNLGNASASFIDKMRQQHRLQANAQGVEEPWLCPSNPENQELERASFLEIVRKYDVDGIHFDYIRYPDGEHCYCAGCRSRFEAATAKAVADWPHDVLRGGPRYTEYQQFRRDNITRLVKSVSEQAHKLKPRIKVSAAVFGSWPDCRESVGQDWGAWVKAGYLDFVCPMDYTSSNSAYHSMIQVQKAEIQGRIPLYPGVGASAPGLNAAQVIDQVQIVREEKADGFTVFNYDPRTYSDQFPMLSLGATRK